MEPRNRMNFICRALIAAAALALLTSCGDSLALLTSCGDSSTKNNTQGDLPMTLTIKCAAFEPNAPIPKKHTGEGEDVSPALQWSGIPKEAKELALICDDPDAPTPKPWVHWVIYGLPLGTASLPENVKQGKTLAVPANARQGITDFGKIGYNGPMPPKGHGTHHYHFKLYALDAPLNLEAGLTKDAFLAAAKKHILAQGEVIGTYERK